jgi:creatinine amidohydrolase
MAKNPHLIADLSWAEYKETLESKNPVVMLPIGSLEQHGPHSPNGSDEILTRLISEAIAERIDGLVAPSVPYGVRSQPRTGGGGHFPGTTNIRGRTLVHFVRDILRGLASHGVKRIAIMDSHYENEWFIIEAIHLALREFKIRDLKDVCIIRFRYFDLLDQEIVDQTFPQGFPGWDLEHAGVMTTSMHLHLTPKLVDMSKVPNHGVVRYPPYPTQGTQTGCLNSPAAATADNGRRIFSCSVDKLVEIMREEFKLQIQIEAV